MTTPAAIEKFTARRDVLRQEKETAIFRLQNWLDGDRLDKNEGTAATRGWCAANSAFLKYDRTLNNLIRRNVR